MREIPIIVCIDVEPDKRAINHAIAEDWTGFGETIELFAALRSSVEKATSAPAYFTWFVRMDPQVEQTYGSSLWAVKRYGDFFEQVEQTGDEVGLHTHPWRWDDSVSQWIIDQGNQEWVEHCVNMSFDAYRSAFGRACVSFRFGDRWMNNETRALLESLGVKFDLTIEPGRNRMPLVEEIHTGALPDCTFTPTWPYQPSRHDYRKMSSRQGRDLWEIPISTGRYMGRMDRLKHMAMAIGISLHNRSEAMPLNLCLGRPAFRAIVNDLLGTGEKRYLAPVVRTDAAIRSHQRSTMEDNMRFILSHPLASRFRFVSPAGAIKLLTESDE